MHKKLFPADWRPATNIFESLPPLPLRRPNEVKLSIHAPSLSERTGKYLTPIFPKKQSYAKFTSMKKAILILAIIFISNLVGLYFGMYSVWWFDMIHHFLGGFFVAMLMWHYLSDGPNSIFHTPYPKLKQYLILVGAVSFIGVVWEFTEYLASQTLIEPMYKYLHIRAYFIGDLDDTINDLLMDILGALSFMSLKRK